MTTPAEQLNTLSSWAPAWKSRDEKKESLEKKMNDLIDAFLDEANPYSEEPSIVLQNLEWSLSSAFGYNIERYQNILIRCKILQHCLKFIKDYRVPREFFQMGREVSSSQQTTHNHLLATIILDEHIEDLVAIMTAKETIEENSPLITSSRNFSKLLKEKQTTLQNDWWIFQSKTKRFLVCLPKEGPSGEALLQKLGYNTHELSRLCDFDEKIPLFEEMSDLEYQESLAHELPNLFVNQQLKKRFNLIGHGVPTEKLDDEAQEDTRGRFAGLTIPQFKKVFSQLEAVGMDFMNIITCFGGGKNLMEVFYQFPRTATVAVCSTTDMPVLAGIPVPPSESKFSIRLRKVSQFWKEIEQVLEKLSEF